MNGTELRATLSLAAIFATRLLGLFMIYPIFAQYARGLSGADDRTIGLALGAYGLTQGLLQIPFGILSDRIGRKKVIVGGLVLFAFGSVVAAMSSSIHGVLIGRTIQGAGAIGSSVLAMVADLTREEVRTRAMAVVGITIGFSFALAVLVGPPLAAAFGLSGMFWATAGFALAAIAITLLLTPTPVRAVPRGVSRATFKRVLQDGQLLRLDFSVFILHAILTASFLIIPSALHQALGLTAAGEWKFYLPVMGGAMALMVPAVIVAETRGRMKEVFIAAIVAILASSGDARGGPGERRDRRRRDDPVFHRLQCHGGDIAVAGDEIRASRRQGRRNRRLFQFAIRRDFRRRRFWRLDASRQRRARSAWPDHRAVADLARRRSLHASPPAAPAPDGSRPDGDRAGLTPPDFAPPLWRLGQGRSYIPLTRNFARHVG